MFNKSNFCHIASNNRNEQKGSVFIYKTTDTLAQVTQNGYFNEKLIDINLHDLIIHIQVDAIGRTVKKNVLIVTERTLDNVNTEVTIDQTLQNDLAELGDQVAGIEEKIPSNASAANQLATASDINTKITNCITEIPQDIKLELANGVLTLKKGSKLYYPNGTGKYEIYTVGQDIQASSLFGNFSRFVYVNVNNNSMDASINAFSGDTAPTVSGTGFWYDTGNNVIKRTTDSGATWTTGFSFPIAIVTSVNDVATNIDQVFNGFGYIGGTVFTLPGIKGLVPNGRNADGTLNNANVFNATTVKINTPADGECNICVSRYSGYTDVPYVGTYIYNAKDNFVQRSSDGLVGGYILAGKFTKKNGQITDFYVRPAFHAVDYSDTEYMAHQAMPSDKFIDLTLGASDTRYAAPADGYVMLKGNTTVADKAYGITNESNGMRTLIRVQSSGSSFGTYMPVSAQQQYSVKYEGALASGYTFRFVYANGVK